MAFFKNRYHQPIYNESGKQKRPAEDIGRLIQNNQKECFELEALAEVYKIFLAVPEVAQDKEKLKKMLSSQDSYRDDVVFSDSRELRNLPLNPRVDGKNLLDAISPQFQEELLNIKSFDEIEALFNKRLQQNGIELKEFDFKVPIPADMRRVIRLEFDGAVEKQDEDILSPLYRAREPKVLDKKEFSFEGFEKLLDDKSAGIDLDKFPAWQKFAKFESFRRIEDDAKHALAFANISPDMADTLRVADIEDALWLYKNHQKETAMAKKKAEMEAHGIPTDDRSFEVSDRIGVIEGARAKTVKIFEKNHGKEFTAMLKELNVDGADIARAVSQMRKGILPKVNLPDGRRLVPTVHHDHAIQDAGYLQDMTQVNHIKNFRIMFDVEQKKVRGGFSNSGNYSSREKIELQGDFDLNMLRKDEESRKQAIQKLALENIEPIFMGLRKMGIPTEAVQELLLTMHKEGVVNNVEFESGKYVGLDLKKTEYGARLILSKRSFPQNQAPGMHKQIMHAIDGAPQSIDFSAPQHEVLAAGEGRNGEENYDVKGVKSALGRLKNKISRIAFKAKDVMPIAVVGAFKKTIELGKQDLEDWDNRFNLPENSNRRNYQSSRGL